MELDEKMKNVLQILSQNGDMATLDIAMRSGLSMKTTQKKLNELLDAGYVRQIQEDGSRLYQIVSLDIIPIKCDTTKDASVSKKIFISHANKDQNFVKHLVQLLINVGISDSCIFCSSIVEYGIPEGENIAAYLRNVINHDTYMIYVISPRYYESATSLNEMGAGWILNCPSSRILMRDLEVREMRGVYNSSTIAITIKDKGADARILKMLRLIEQQLSITIHNDNICIEKINTFLQSARRCGPKRSKRTK